MGRITTEPPEGIVITVSAGMIGDHGYRHWLRNFLESMKQSEETCDWNYYFRVGGQPRQDKHIQYVYLCIGGKIRFRVFYAGSQAGGKLNLSNGHRYRIVEGRAWILTAGPVERAPHPIPMKGFQGFRYTHKLF